MRLMTNTQQIAAAFVLVFVIVGGVLLGLHLGGSTSYGNTINPNPEGYPAGIAFGKLNSLWLSDQLKLVAGRNQMSWKNTTGSTVLIQLAHASQTGTASSTYKIYVGTSTAATATDSFLPATAPFWSQLIDGFSVSTGTPAGVWADNIVNHKTGFPAEVQVTAGQYLLLVADSFCTANGPCETATSSTRGWTLTLPFRYIAAGTP